MTGRRVPTQFPFGTLTPDAGCAQPLLPFAASSCTLTVTFEPTLLQAYDRAAVAWNTDPQGYQTGWSGLKLPARELAKLGYLYLNGGRWDGVQIIPASYVRASTQAQSQPPPNVPFAGYGYQWWVTHENGHPSFVAVGLGGQFIQVVPDLDLVVVITSDAANRRGDAQNLVGEVIIPAIVD